MLVFKVFHNINPNTRFFSLTLSKVLNYNNFMFRYTCFSFDEAYILNKDSNSIGVLRSIKVVQWSKQVSCRLEFNDIQKQPPNYKKMLLYTMIQEIKKFQRKFKYS